jgi:hypothetical protein
MPAHLPPAVEMARIGRPDTVPKVREKLSGDYLLSSAVQTDVLPARAVEVIFLWPSVECSAYNCILADILHAC